MADTADDHVVGVVRHNLPVGEFWTVMPSMRTCVCSGRDDQPGTKLHGPDDSGVARGPRLRPPALAVAVDSAPP